MRIISLILIISIILNVESEAVFGKKKISLFGKDNDSEYIIISGGPALRKWEDLRIENTNMIVGGEIL